MSILHLISQDSFIAVNQKLIDLFGLYEAAIVGLFASVNNYNQLTQPDYDGWFYVTYDKMEQKLKLTEDKAAQPIKNLEKAGIIEIKRKGVPCRKYFKFNQEKLLNYLIPSSTPKNGGQETGNSGDKKSEKQEASTGESREQVGGKTAGNKKTDKNIDNNISFSSDEIKKYFSDNNLKSDAEDFINFYESIGWMKGKNKIINWIPEAKRWEKNHAEMFPEKHEKTLNDQNSESINKLRDILRSEITRKTTLRFYDDCFGGKPIEKTENGFKMTVDNPKAADYQDILDKLNIELQLSN